MHFDERIYFCILIKHSLKLIPNGPVENNALLSHALFYCFAVPT